MCVAFVLRGCSRLELLWCFLLRRLCACALESHGFFIHPSFSFLPPYVSFFGILYLIIQAVHPITQLLGSDHLYSVAPSTSSEADLTASASTDPYAAGAFATTKADVTAQCTRFPLLLFFVFCFRFFSVFLSFFVLFLLLAQTRQELI